MARDTAAEILFGDPLSEVTRRERIFLLGFSAVGIVIVKAGIVPTKISALGVEFSQTNQAAMLKMLAAVVLYFLCAFVLYCLSDLIRLRMSYHGAATEVAEEARRERREIGRPGIVVYQRVAWPYLLVALIRAILFDFTLPIALGIYAAVLLLRAR